MVGGGYGFFWMDIDGWIGRWMDGWKDIDGVDRWDMGWIWMDKDSYI